MLIPRWTRCHAAGCIESTQSVGPAASRAQGAGSTRHDRNAALLFQRHDLYLVAMPGPPGGRTAWLISYSDFVTQQRRAGVTNCIGTQFGNNCLIGTVCDRVDKR